MAKSPKERIDLLLVQLGLVASRERARRLIIAGQVLVDDQVVDKAGTRVAVDAAVRLKLPDHPYVGRGGVKLAGALDDFGIDPAGLRCLDVGSSTGGFTDCLLQRGAAFVTAVDVGSAQLAWKLRQDPRVQVFEQCDIRSLEAEARGEPASLTVVDVSFISLRLVLPAVLAHVRPGSPILVLFKPQFEVGRAGLAAGGVARDQAEVQRALGEVVAVIEHLECGLVSQAPCRITGARKGNQEHFLYLRAPDSIPLEHEPNAEAT